MENHGERPRLSELRARHQSRRIGPKSSHDRKCDMSELRKTSSLAQDLLVQADQRSIIKKPTGEKTLSAQIIGCR